MSDATIVRSVQFERTHRLAVNQADVAAKVIDGEAIVMNLSNGIYYSLTGTGAWVWELLENGHSVGEVADALVRRYEVDEGTAWADTTAVAVRILDEGLMHESIDAAAGSDPVDHQEGSERYLAPELKAFNDMADLLALDPPMPGLARTPWQDPADDA
jgi:fermentation-respiration switch protein FrsA (DUF1100 family)